MIIGFTGTRQGPTPAQHAAMDRFLIGMFVNHTARVLVHGGAVHSDTMAHEVVRRVGGEIWVFPAEEGILSSAAREPFDGIIADPVPALMRNRIIAGLCDGLLAVPASDTEEQRSGTWATVRYARKRGCPVLIVQKSGKVVWDKPLKRCADCRIDEVRFLCRHPNECWQGKQDKVRHVVRARQTRLHRCHWPGCREQVPPAKWGCLSHWKRLPKRIRDEIWRTYRIGQEADMRPSPDYLVIAREAQVWIRTKGDPL